MTGQPPDSVPASESAPRDSRPSSGDLRPAPQRPSSPELSHRVLAAELKRVRLDAGLTHVQLARTLGWPQAKLSKIESAKQGVGVDAVMAITETCGVEGDHRAHLVELARQARRKGWWESYRDVLPPDRRSYVGLESDASTVRVFATESVPELLQTTDYAEAQLRARAGSAAERRLQLLLDRQRQVLARAEDGIPGRAVRPSPRVETVLAESALYRFAGEAQVLAEQRYRLVAAARSQAVSVRVVPFRSGPLPLDGSFTLLGFGDGRHPDAAFRSDRVGWERCVGENALSVHQQAWRELTTMALDTAESIRFLVDLAGAESVP
ncbi:helix-turn-helix domain-containing protein [Allosaccharopolyspora coralli]|nr:helix-turn-helix transcriptional regulator [Allosaccharopolyspora coralli]